MQHTYIPWDPWACKALWKCKAPLILFLSAKVIPSFIQVLHRGTSTSTLLAAGPAKLAVSMQRSTFKWVLHPSSAPRLPIPVLTALLTCQVIPGATVVHETELLSSSPACLSVPTHCWHHSPASVGLSLASFGRIIEVGGCRVHRMK